MERRTFVSGTLGAVAGSGLASSAAAGAGAASAPAEPSTKPAPRLFELRSYLFRFGPMESRFADYAKGALVPALNRAGIRPVGAFTVAVGSESPSLHLLLPHPDASSVVGLDAKLSGDEEYRRGGAALLGLPASDPPYVSLESSLMAGFDSVPGIEAPTGDAAGAGRVFELRTYVSPNRAAGRKKIEMFESAGELRIFRRLGLTPVFFARNVVGPRLPSLSYMLVFPDMAAREKAWAAFRDDPEWQKLRTTPGFGNAEIMTSIHIRLLRPTDYSQI
jgi:hypothetical protein